MVAVIVQLDLGREGFLTTASPVLDLFWNWIAVWPYWFTGMVFSILHLASNPLVFALPLPVVANAILEYYGSTLRALN